ncbi:heavy metal translocating P-type ATPase [Candidatus Contubernalis alkaliaceticus]|uniref:heavy metal translocating P-type ATPase n=1 Tax=Candidatus Contubernalis alkaliaceticus TaxID=338645 RepID=UPI001F4C33DB|nr:heavy metal translocating P-type ATPase [Candidatus Contubernalis alkalaceticus]UNC93106.1 cadmium-translocating P-type ATPase [Candidatus Contubernalis alkalaceticus]
MIGRYTEVKKYKELLQKKEFYTISLGLLLIILSFLLGDIKTTFPLANLLALSAVTLLGGPIIVEAVRGLLRKEVNVDELVSLAIIASVLAGEYQAAAIVALIMVLGSLVEQFTSQKARSAILSLMELKPEKASLLRGKEEISISIKELTPGDIVIVRVGDKVPVDGLVAQGNALLDQASLTGESMPVEKNPGDEVFAGTIVHSGLLEIKTQTIGENTALGNMVRLVQKAEEQRAPIVRTADRYARYFTPVILAISLTVYLFTGDFHRSITVLIVGCPCAFILASPTAIVSALGNASKKGVLIKGGDILEEVSRVDTLIFDKTGTLTTGRPVVTAITPVPGISKEHLLSRAAAVEKCSLHPLAKAVTASAKKRNLTLHKAENIINLPGAGIEAQVESHKIFVGSPTPEELNLLTEQYFEIMDLEKILSVKENDSLLGFIHLREELRPEVPAVINSLKKTEISQIYMLSGDRQQAVCTTAEKAGIINFMGDMLPEDKLVFLRNIQEKNAQVAMVGDGVNDAPSLVTANVGIAMGVMGTDAAIESADIALMGDDLTKLPFLFLLGKQTVKTIHYNIFFALFFNLLALIASGSGLLNPVTGAITHNIGSILVVVNSALLLRFSEKKPVLIHKYSQKQVSRQVPVK